MAEPLAFLKAIDAAGWDVAAPVEAVAEAWAQFRLAHPELYDAAIRQSPAWPYLVKPEVTRVG